MVVKRMNRDTRKLVKLVCEQYGFNRASTQRVMHQVEARVGRAGVITEDDKDSKGLSCRH